MILIVDDDERLRSLMIDILKLHAYSAIGARSANEARSLLMTNNFDAIIVDWMMPHESGIDLIKSIRSSVSHVQNIPAIMLTAIDGRDNKVTGFDAGYDDYITKPFEACELIARLRSLIRRTKKKTAARIVKFGDCEFNMESGILLRNSKDVRLTTTELMLLKELCQRPNATCPRSELAKKFNFKVSDRTIDVQIARLRRKIGDTTKDQQIIRTVRYIGYTLHCLP
ncbi:MAG: response regulator transcription factor [Holosporales bacterium]|nr:response regulator transcription factor [Holosporales bacterium]